MTGASRKHLAIVGALVQMRSPVGASCESRRARRVSRDWVPGRGIPPPTAMYTPAITRCRRAWVRGGLAEGS